MPVPEETRAQLSQLLWDLVEENLPDGEFWRRWSGLPRQRGGSYAPLEVVVQQYLQLRRDPYARHFSHVSFGATADPRYLSFRKCLREKTAQLGPPAGPSTVRLPLPAGHAEQSAVDLPLTSDAPASGISGAGKVVKDK